MNIMLSFCINDYPGTGNDLRGCLNDQKNLINALQKEGFNFIFRVFRNDQCRKYNVVNQINKAVSELQAGDILLIQHSHHGSQIPDRHGDEKDGYDEVFCMYDEFITDDEYNTMLSKLKDGVMCVVFADCCFSGSNTRDIGSHKKFRFLPPKDNYQGTVPVKQLSKGGNKWIAIAMCKENETSADAYIDREWQGAGTHYFIKNLKKGITYCQWIENVLNELPNSNYKQTPSIEGPENFLHMKVFEPIPLGTRIKKSVIKTADRSWKGIDGKKTLTGIIFAAVLAVVYFVNAKWPNTIPEWVIDVIKMIAQTFFGIGVVHKIYKYYNKTEMEFNSLIKIQHTFSIGIDKIKKYFNTLAKKLRK